MRVAVCVSGESRTYRTASVAIKRFFDAFNPDYFLHTYNSNTWLNCSLDKEYADRYTFEDLDTEKLYQDLFSTFNPKALLITQRQCNRSHWVAAQGQQFSMLAANNLKLTYEIANNFIYDLVVRIRFDIVWPPTLSFSPILPLDHNTLYVTHVDRTNVEYRAY